MSAPAPQSLRLARALALLTVGSQDADGPALAEALWLAHLLPATVPVPPSGKVAAPTPPTPTAGTAPTDAQPEIAPPAAPPVAAAAPDRVALFTPQIDAAGAGSLRGSRVRVPAADALPQAARIERALRPFMRRYPSRVLRELDPAATAQASAERQQVTPVFRPQRERWFDVALVLDDSESMGVWSATARELKALLARHGAFRQVRLWRLHAVGGRIVLHSEAGLDTGARTLAGEEGRTLVLLLTHGTGAGWRDDLVGAWLRDLARRATVALVQMLPRHAWPYTALGDATERVLSRERAAPNRRLRLRDPIAGGWTEMLGGEAVPVLPLDAAAIAYWAQFVMTPRRLDHPAMWIGSGRPDDLPAAAADAAAVDARQRVERFRAIASPDAFALLRLLATAPVTLPVMRLLQRAASRAPSAASLAEVLLSGLLRRVVTGASEEEHVYDFDPEVRDWLAGSQSGAERRAVDAALDPTRERLREFVERQSGRRVKDFGALVLDPQGDELLPAEARAFVEVSRRMYERQGVLPVDGRERRAPGATPAFKASTQATKLLRVALLRGDDLRRPPPLETALRSALTERGHEVMTADADVVVLITDSRAAADADVIVQPQSDAAGVIEAVEQVRPLGALHGWARDPERLVDRSVDAHRLHALLAERLLGGAGLPAGVSTAFQPNAFQTNSSSNAARSEPGTIAQQAGITALPLSGARCLLGAVLSQTFWRQTFPGGIWLDQPPPPPVLALRRGPRLLIVEGEGRSVAQGPVDSVLRLTAMPSARAPADIGYIDPQTLHGDFVRRGIEPERVDAAIEISRGIPLLVGPTAVALQRGATPLAALPDEPEERIDAVVGWMLDALLKDERETLLFMAAWQPGFGRQKDADGHAGMVRELGWLHDDGDSHWLPDQARRAIGRADPDGLRGAHDTVILALRSREARLLRYACRYLLLHLWSARGEAGVLADLRNVKVMRPLLDTDRAAVMGQLRTLARAKPPPPELLRVLSLWEKLTDHATRPAPELADAIANLAGAPPVRTWQAPPGTGIADAVRAGVSGEGIVVWVPSTGCDPQHPALQGAQLSGDLGDKQGHGTSVVSLIASPRQGVAPGVRVRVTRMLDDRGSGDMATMLRVVLSMLDLSADELPQIACWALGQPLSGPSLDGLQRELAGALRALSERGMLIVAAAGNEGEGRLSFPAVLPWVLAAGACDLRGEPAVFSSRGEFPIRRLEGVDDHERRVPDLYGYGVDIPVAVVGRRSPFQQQSGTSFAAAYVAGIAALWAQSTGLRGDALKEALIFSAAEHGGIARWVPPRDAQPEGSVAA
jgi:hypothetical protein